MQDEMALTGNGFDPMSIEDEGGVEETTLISSPRKVRRSLRAIWNSWSGDRRSSIFSFFLTAAIVGTLVGTVLTSLAIWQHNGRTQAVQRAMKMDNEVYTIKAVAWNWIGDTKLYLLDENGKDAGWVMIHMNNPFTSKVNPLFLSFSDKRHDPLPFPMKVRTHRLDDAWKGKDFRDRRENFTGSFLEFEILDEEQTVSNNRGESR